MADHLFTLNNQDEQVLGLIVDKYNHDNKTSLNVDDYIGVVIQGQINIAAVTRINQLQKDIKAAIENVTDLTKLNRIKNAIT